MAVSAIHAPVVDQSVSSHPILKQFLKGLLHLHPPIKAPILGGDVPMVLCCLTWHPFEQAATCDLRLLSFKTLFLLAVTSARRVSELYVLTLPTWFSFFTR